MQGKKNSGPAALLFVVLLIVLLGVGVWWVGNYEPVKLAALQEQVLGLVHGGVSAPQEKPPVIDGCITFPSSRRTSLNNTTIIINGEQRFVENGLLIENTTNTKAIKREERNVRFGNRAELSVTFSSPPVVNTDCP